MIKILAVGNSFSQDATTHLELLAKGLYVRNLFIGGCSLETHCRHARDEDDAYAYQKNGKNSLSHLVSLKWGLLAEKWDYITVQQVSGLSGVRESYDPYMEELLAYIRAHSDAEILFHRTWAYEKHSGHAHFPRYDCDQGRMWDAIRAATDDVADKWGLRIIPAGDFIAALRTEQFFDIDRGGVSLSRDGYHLGHDYGRVAAAAVWAKFFTGEVPAFFDRVPLAEGFQIMRKYL